MISHDFLLGEHRSRLQKYDPTQADTQNPSSGVECFPGSSRSQEEPGPRCGGFWVRWAVPQAKPLSSFLFWSRSQGQKLTPPLAFRWTTLWRPFGSSSIRAVAFCLPMPRRHCWVAFYSERLFGTTSFIYFVAFGVVISRSGSSLIRFRPQSQKM